MKKFSFLILFLSILSFSFSQLIPVKWSFEKESLGNNEYNLIYKASIQDGWYVYSQFLKGDGPVATNVVVEKNEGVTLIGKVSETGDKIKEGFDKIFEMDIKKFAHSATFTQKVKVTDNAKISGYVEFMTCNDEMCLPPDDEVFSFTFAKQADKKQEATTASTGKKEEKVISSITEKEIKKEVVADKIIAAPEKKKEILQNVKGDVKELNNIQNEVLEETKPAPTHTDEPVILEPVKWTMSAKKLSGNKALLTFNAIIEEHWGVYAQELENEDGPIATTFTFEENENVNIEKGFLKEISDHVVEGYDKMFEMNIKKFKESVSFTKEIDITNANGNLKGYLEFMTCDDEQCLPPAFVDYEINLKTLKTKIGDELSEAVEVESGTNNNMLLTNVDLDNPVSNCGELKVVDDKGEKKGFWVVFLMGLLGGFVALLTPCVFPMIPLTVSYFTKGSQEKKGLFNAFLYGFFIILVYGLLSLPFHLLDSLDPNILNNISTNVWLNLVFFAIFIFFAGSFFGYYEIELPSSFADKSSKAEGSGGVIGIFFMAVTLAIVSFSCTGPILGMLMGTLASSGGAGATSLTAGMLGFGVAFALPFTLFAAFPKLLNSLPSSGGWMNTVKVVLGFIEVALALKFLSNADLVRDWGILKYEVFIVLWIIIFAGLALYLFGKIKFPHDSPIKKLSKVRIALGTLTTAFVIYLCTAFMFNEDTKTFTSLNLLSGLAPSAGYSWIYPVHCPQNFECVHDLDEAFAIAKKVNKPIMIDFTGKACVNCRKVEETVWDKPQIKTLIEDEFVLVSLYVDKDVDLPKDEQITVEYNGKQKKLRTVGNKWAYVEYANFQQVSQPYYVLLSPDGKLLNQPIGYSSKSDYIEQYEAFLKCGIEANKGL